MCRRECNSSRVSCIGKTTNSGERQAASLLVMLHLHWILDGNGISLSSLRIIGSTAKFYIAKTSVPKPCLLSAYLCLTRCDLLETAASDSSNPHHRPHHTHHSHALPTSLHPSHQSHRHNRRFLSFRYSATVPLQPLSLTHIPTKAP